MEPGVLVRGVVENEVDDDPHVPLVSLGNQFAEIIDANGDEAAGRTLGFLSQEMLREANTIGSKCLDVDVSRRIVEVKGAIDRIKEQVQNVE